MFIEAINPGINDGTPVQTPFHVTGSEFPTRSTGFPAPRTGTDGIDWTQDHVSFYVAANKVVRYNQTNTRQNLELDVQCATGIQVFFTFSDPTLVLADIDMANGGGSTWKAMWTELTLDGTTTHHGTVPGNATGVRFAGTGLVNLGRL